MIKFFRQIRRKLLDDNRISMAASPVGKYFLYAFGEILLVVFGILIALQVNTWNQSNKNKNLEESILIEIQGNLSDDLIEIIDEAWSFQVVMDTDSILIRHVKAKAPYTDSIGALIHLAQMSPHFPPVRSGYKLLESKGIELISDDSLRMQITNLYEWQYPYYATYAEERFRAIESFLLPYWTQHFEIDRHFKFPWWKRVPIDYDKLIDDPQFVPLIQTSLFHARVMKRKSERLTARLESLQERIKNYLDSIQNDL